MAIALLSRVLTSYQALILLAERGFASEVKAVSRNILEARFKVGSLAEEPKTPWQMLAKHEEARIKRLKKYQNGKLPVPKYAAGQNWEKLIETATKRFKELELARFVKHSDS